MVYRRAGLGAVICEAKFKLNRILRGDNHMEQLALLKTLECVKTHGETRFVSFRLNSDSRVTIDCIKNYKLFANVGYERAANELGTIIA